MLLGYVDIIKEGYVMFVCLFVLFSFFFFFFFFFFTISLRVKFLKDETFRAETFLLALE